MTENNNSADVGRALAGPFHSHEVRWKPQAVRGNRAMAIAYVDVRAIMDRLDQVVGFDGWQDDYELLPEGSVTCRLRLSIGRTWITKTDVGSPSEQPDAGDRLKAAFSDALKRAAVKFGVGRYLYRLPQQWVDYDVAKKQIVEIPKLPAWAIASPNDTPAHKNGQATKALPANGKELLNRLTAADAELAKAGTAPAGALLAHVRAAGVKAGHPADLAIWHGPAIELAVAEVRTFKKGLSQTSPEVDKAKRFAADAQDKKAQATGSKA